VSTFMGYALIVSALFGLAAIGMERALMSGHWPRRTIWLVTLAASVLFPVGMATYDRSSAALPSTFQIYPNQILPDSGQDAVNASQPSPSIRRDSTVGGVAPAPPIRKHAHFDRRMLDRGLAVLWLASSLVLVLVCTTGWMRVRRSTRALPATQVEGIYIKVTENTGPAVVGFASPDILMPRWMIDGDPTLRFMALAHERQHLIARDPLMLLIALLLVAAMPWNPLLWWQLRCLRFAIEADCDARVLSQGVERSRYAECLLAVGQHKVSSRSGVLVLAMHNSWLERRVRILASDQGRLSSVVATLGIAAAAVLIVGAGRLHAPALETTDDLRKLPGEDLRPAAQWARDAVRERFPELFGTHFDGTVLVALVFNRDGSLRLANKHAFALGMTATDFNLAEENKELGIDPSSLDIVTAGREAASFTIGPWLDSKNRDRLFVVYEVLRWQPDPSRTADRVRSIVEHYDSVLLEKSSDTGIGAVQMTVFINSDGTVNRASENKFRLGQSYTITEDALDRFAALGIAREQLGRHGGTNISSAGKPNIIIDYAWARQPSDPEDPDGWDNGSDRGRKFLQMQWKADTHDDEAIVQRYFADIAQEGDAAVTEVVDDRKLRLVPWILFGRDGRIWASGRSHTESCCYRLTSLEGEIEARFPGVIVQQEITNNFDPAGWHVNGVPIRCLWIAADSPIQRKEDVDLSRRAELLLTGAFRYSPGELSATARDVTSFDFSKSMTFGKPEPLRFGFYSPAAQRLETRNVRVSATEPGADEVTLVVQTKTEPSDWQPFATLRVPYGSRSVLELPNTNDGQPGRVRLILRPQRFDGT
jgi:beta-lactamase regulating signal transducer with metallopeptidase domain